MASLHAHSCRCWQCIDTKNRQVQRQETLAAVEAGWSGEALAKHLTWPTTDEFAQHIRWINGANKLGAGALAENLLDWLRTRVMPK